MSKICRLLITCFASPPFTFTESARKSSLFTIFCILLNNLFLFFLRSLANTGTKGIHIYRDFSMIRFRLSEIKRDSFLKGRGEEISTLQDWSTASYSENNGSVPKNIFLLSQTDVTRLVYLGTGITFSRQVCCLCTVCIQLFSAFHLDSQEHG